MDRKAIIESMARILKQPVERFADTALLSDLVMDSFILVDMVIDLQDELGIFLVQEDLKHVKTVGELLAVLEAATKASA